MTHDVEARVSVHGLSISNRGAACHTGLTTEASRPSCSVIQKSKEDTAMEQAWPSVVFGPGDVLSPTGAALIGLESHTKA